MERTSIRRTISVVKMPSFESVMHICFLFARDFCTLWMTKSMTFTNSLICLEAVTFCRCIKAPSHSSGRWPTEGDGRKNHEIVTAKRP